MSDVPQAPYGEEGDARPVSLIGARIPPSSSPPSAENPPSPSSGSAASSARDERLARRRRRRGGDLPASPPEARDAEAFHLHDAPGGGVPGHGEGDSDQATPAGGTAAADSAAGGDTSAWPDDVQTGSPEDGRLDQGGRPGSTSEGAYAPPRRTPPVRSAAPRSRPAGRPSAVPPATTAPPTSATHPMARPAAEPNAPEGAPIERAVEPTRSSPAAEGEPRPAAARPRSREIVAVSPAETSPTVRAEPGTELQPWQEPDRRAGKLEAWEEIPVRLSLTDRAAGALEGSWRIAVTSMYAGSGTTTVTAGLGLILADVRGEDVVAVDTSLAGELVGNGDPGHRPNDGTATLGVSLSRRLGAHPVTTISTLARHRTDPFPPEDIVRLVSGESGPRTAGAVDVVAAHAADLRAERADPAAVVPTDDLVTPTALRASLRMLSDGYPLLLLDAPGDSPLTPAVLRGADVVVLVVLATPIDLDAAAAYLRDPDGMSARLGEPPPPVVAVVVSVRRGRWSPQTRAAAARLSRRVDAMLRLPYDMRLDSDGGAPTPVGRLRRRSRRALLGLAAVLVDTLVDEQDAQAVAAADDAPRGGGWDLEKGSGVSSDQLRSASPIGDAPDRPGDPSPARKDS